MALSLVLGPANSAKAGEVLGAYVAAARRDALLVVPTQADALHYDRELAGAGVSLGRALTFDGLLGEIATRAGYRRPRLSDLRRDLIIRRAVRGLELPALRQSAETPGFSAAVGRFIASLRAQRVTPQRFSAALSAWRDDAMSRDLAAIYRAYAGALARADAEDGESHAWGALDALRADPEAWRGTPVFLYGFDDLTRIEKDAVETLARTIGVPVTVSLTYEPGRPALAARAGVVEELKLLAASVRELPAQDTHYAAPALHHLERNLFQPAPDPPIRGGDAVQLLEAGGELAEAELVAAGVLAAIQDGVRAEDIVVVCRSLRRSGALLERALARYGVPATSARRIPFTHTALGRGVAAVARRDPLPYLRLLADPGTVDALEADARRAGGAEIAARLPHRLSDAVANLLPRAHGRPLRATEERDVRAAAVLTAALEELDGLTSEETLELLGRLELSAGPTGGVLVAEPLSIRARRFRRVFVTGLCEGEFPVGDPPDPFLGEDRRRELALASGLALEPELDAAARERYLLYACVSRASERISFSYRVSDEDGNRISRSPFLDDITRLFSDLPVRRRMLADVIWSPAEAPTPREHALAAAGVTLGSPPPADAAETRTLGPAALAHVRHTRRVSPGALEIFARCPVSWLVDRQLHPEDLEPEAAPLVKGTFMHEVLARVLAGEPDVLDNLSPPSALAPASPPAVRAAILTGIVAELRRYLAFEAANPAPGFHASVLEHAFEVELEPGLVVNGVVDRVDVNAAGQAIVRDYKSGQDRFERAANRWLADHTLQVGLYMLAVSRLLELEVVAGVYQPLAGRDLRPRGAVLAGAPVNVRPGDLLDAEGLAELLAAIEAEARTMATALRGGALTPCPATCSPDGCRHPGICWAGR